MAGVEPLGRKQPRRRVRVLPRRVRLWGERSGAVRGKRGREQREGESSKRREERREERRVWCE